MGKKAAQACPQGHGCLAGTTCTALLPGKRRLDQQTLCVPARGDLLELWWGGGHDLQRARGGGCLLVTPLLSGASPAVCQESWMEMFTAALARHPPGPNAG